MGPMFSYIQGLEVLSCCAASPMFCILQWWDRQEWDEGGWCGGDKGRRSSSCHHLGVPTFLLLTWTAEVTLAACHDGAKTESKQNCCFRKMSSFTKWGLLDENLFHLFSSYFFLLLTLWKIHSQGQISGYSVVITLNKIFSFHTLSLCSVSAFCREICHCSSASEWFSV